MGSGLWAVSPLSVVPLKIGKNKKIPTASRRGILDAFEKSLAKPNSIFAPRGGVLDPKLHNNCKPGGTHRETPSLCKITTLERVNLAEDRRQHSRGGLPIFHSSLNFTTIFPKFSPRNKPMNASGAFSNPSTTVSFHLIFPSPIHCPMSFRN